jgi:hypothetical protein
MRRAIASTLAFFVASLIPAVILAVTSPWAEGRWRSMLGLTVVFYSWSLVATLLMAVPLYFVFRRLDWIRWWSVLVSGAVIGGIWGFIVGGEPSVLLAVVSMAGIGVASALAFWLIWKRGRPAAEPVDRQ